MSEVSLVSNLIFRLIAVAIAAGCIGTAYDLLSNTKEDASYAIIHHRISYLKWNDMLISNRPNKPKK
jgi:hypothetical protein